jgi:hypothetical protein
MVGSPVAKIINGAVYPDLVVSETLLLRWK